MEKLPSWWNLGLTVLRLILVTSMFFVFFSLRISKFLAGLWRGNGYNWTLLQLSWLFSVSSVCVCAWSSPSLWLSCFSLWTKNSLQCLWMTFLFSSGMPKPRPPGPWSNRVFWATGGKAGTSCLVESRFLPGRTENPAGLPTSRTGFRRRWFSSLPFCKSKMLYLLHATALMQLYNPHFCSFFWTVCVPRRCKLLSDLLWQWETSAKGGFLYSFRQWYGFVGRILEIRF